MVSIVWVIAMPMQNIKYVTYHGIIPYYLLQIKTNKLRQYESEIMMHIMLNGRS